MTVSRENLQPRPAAPTRSSWLKLAQWTWYAAAALALAVIVAAAPAYGLRLSGARLGPVIAAPAAYIAVMETLIGLASLFSAALPVALAIALYWRRRGDPAALVSSFYLLIFGIVVGPLEAATGQWQNPVVDVALRFQTFLATTPTLLLLYTFPNGRFVPGWTRWLAWLSLGCLPLAFILPPAELFTLSQPIAQAGVAYWAALAGAGLLAQVLRYRRATAAEQQQTKWVLLGTFVSLVLLVAVSVPYAILLSLPRGQAHPWWAPISELIWWLSLAVLPLSLAVAVLRYRLFDVDLLINRALVYGALTGLVIGVYVVIVGGLGALLQAGGSLLPSLLATGLIAVLFNPVHQRLQRAVDRMMYGERDQPYAVLSRLGRQLEATLAPQAILPAMVETIAEALKLPYAAITLPENGGQRVAAAYGVKPLDADWALHTAPLTFQSERVGELQVARRAPDEPFTPGEQRLLADVARQASAAVHAVRLHTDLQRSRQRLVTTREEERRRLRRDLHDGLGPALAAQTLKVGAARSLLKSDPVAADDLLEDLEAGIAAALADIRRLVYDLRPPELDELGLGGALRLTAAQYGASRGGSSALRISVEVPEPLPALPAAVEVAAYRIAQEALANVVRHAEARTCHVQLSVADGVRLTITDDGRGLPAARRAGVGLASMRERAEELGGTCVVEAPPGGGTRVVVELSKTEASGWNRSES